jgi:hypothetical protein
MKSFSAVVIGLSCVVLAGCSSGDPSFTCAIGELSGTWRIHYEETNGNCGAVADETVVLSPAASQAASAGCTYAAQNISSDKCSLELDFTCPTTDNAGTQHWIGSMHQVAADRLEGSYTVQLQHPQLGTCRSTYDTTMQKQ